MQFKRDTVSGDTLILAADDGLNEDAGEVVAELERLLDQGAGKLIVDGSNLHHMSSSGLSALIRLHHRIRKRGGDMALAGFRDVPRQALEMTRLDRVFELRDTIDEARESLSVDRC